MKNAVRGEEPASVGLILGVGLAVVEIIRRLSQGFRRSRSLHVPTGKDAGNARRRWAGTRGT
jgi:hypothetical protein